MQGGSGNATLASSGGSSITQFGGSGNDSLYSSGGSSILMVGGTGNVTLSSSGGSSITQLGGSGNDSLYSSGGSSIYMQGGTGNATLASSGGSSITLFGGSGNDLLSSSADSNGLIAGGTGTDVLNASGDTNVLLQAGGTTNDILTTTGGSSVTLLGGSGNDTLSANGGSDLVLAGLDGDNTYELSGGTSNPLSAALNDLSTFGQAVSTTDGFTQGTNTILFPGVASGIHLDLSDASQGTNPTAAQVQTVAPGLSLSLTGLFQNVVGTPGNNWIHGDASSNVLSGQGGNDTLIGGTGPATLLAGSGNDSLVGGSGGTTYRFAGSSFGADTVAPASASSNDTLDFAAFAGPVNLDLRSAAAQVVNTTSGLTLTLANPLGISGVIDTASTSNPSNDAIHGNSRGDSFTIGTGNDTITGAGGDSYLFSGTHLGSDTINEAAGTQNTLNFLAFGAPINLNLSQSVTQAAVSPGNLTLTLSNPSAFTTVVGTPYPDTIVGNNSNDTIIGAGGDDSLVGGSGSSYIQGGITQVVYLDFVSGQPDDVVYTPSEESAIQAGLAQDYYGFSYVFTQDPNQAQQLAQMTGGQYQTLDIGSPLVAGGAASQLDVDHVNLGGSAMINISSFLGDQPDHVAPTLTNIVNLTTTIAAHELGHLSGLQHQDAFGPIGTGIYASVNPSSFYPIYTGPENAAATVNDVMASPDSVGTTIQDAAGQTYLGERDLIKLAFNDTGTILQQQNLPTEPVLVSGALPPGTPSSGPFTISQAYVLPPLPGLAVPNTLPSDAPGYGQTFNVTALAVNATLSTPTEQDFYAFQGQAGELMTFEVISNNNTLNPNPILPELLVVGPAGQVLGYNVHEFESSDSSLYDITLPMTGTYYVGVDSLLGLTKGNYQLFMYSFGTDPATGGDTLIAGSGAGNDTIMGSSGNEYYGFQPSFTGKATINLGITPSTVNESTLSVSTLLQQNVTINNPFNLPSNSIALIQPTMTTVSTSSASNSSIYGSAVTLTATVTAPNGTTPTGTVTFYNNGATLGTQTLSSGSVSLMLSNLPAGNDPITASYSSNSSLLTNSTSPPITQVVNQAQPTFSGLTASQSIYYGTPSITLSGHLNANAGQQTIPAGESVTVTIGGVSQSTKLDANDSFTLTFNTQTLGGSITPYTILYSYAGDASFQAASDSSTTLTVLNVATTISVSPSSVTSYFGQPLTLTATVTTKSSNAMVSTGNVDFYDTTTQTDLGTIVLSSNGTAQLKTTVLPAGSQTITLTYADPRRIYFSSGTTATATIVPATYVLNPAASGALSLSGNSSIATPGLLVVDSSSSTAIQASGQAQVSAATIEEVGSYSLSGGASLSSKPTHLSTVVADPLASLLIPSASGLPLQGAVNLSGNSKKTINPGIYTQINVSGNASLTLNPGFSSWPEVVSP